MSRRRMGFTERRKARLALRSDFVLQLEARSLITDPINLAGVALGLPIALQWALPGRAEGGTSSAGGRSVADGPRASASREVPQCIVPVRLVPADAAVAGGVASRASAARIVKPARPPANDWLDLRPAEEDEGADPGGRLAVPSLSPMAGGDQGVGPRGGCAAGPDFGRRGIQPFRVPPPAGADGGSGVASASPTVAAVGTPTRPSGRAATGTDFAAPATFASAYAPSPDASGGSLLSSTPYLTESNASSAALGAFDNFPVYVLDYNDGQVLMPGVNQLASLSGAVDLRAQVRDTAVSSYSWDTSGLTQATNISGANTYRLTFKWVQTTYTAPINSATLTVTDTSSRTESFTYYFKVPDGSGPATSGGGLGTMTWPTSLPPDWELSRGSRFASHNLSVDATSGSVETTIPLPTYNPGVTPLALTYDSITADPRPIVLFPHEIPVGQVVPSKVSGQLTFNGAAGTTWYYDTGQFIAGDVQQVALHADATALPTGRYAYSASLIDYRTTNTTTSVSGTATVINQSNNTGAGTAPFGSGWTLLGLQRITVATGGLILDLGDDGRSLWFTGSFASGGGTYTTPAGEFSTLVKNANGTFTRTLTDGTQATFDSAGKQTAVVDTNGLRTTYAYDGSSQLSTITDPYGKVTTFAYSGGYLQTIKDPANRLTTLVHSGGAGGGNLTAATLPDGATWSYAYDGSGRLTQVTDPNVKTTTVAYDAAKRASLVTRPDSTTESFVANQVRGWTNTGTSGSPAAATLLAEARSTYTDPNGRVTELRPDWRGQGLTNVAVDPLGNASIRDRDANGLATIAVDRLNRITQYGYDSKGNVGTVVYADGKTEKYAYNSFSQVTSATDAAGKTTTYAYDGEGNLTGVLDPLNNRTTMTYTANGRVETSKDANGKVTTYQYDSQDRATTVTNPDSSAVAYGYNAQGDLASITNERGYQTTFSYDALGRRTGTTDALSNRTTITYDSGGNATVVKSPTPSGQTARTTTYSYDSLDRVTTVAAPLSRVTVYGRDAKGDVVKITDPLNLVTTVVYDELDRPTVVKTPLTSGTQAVTTTTYDAEGQVILVSDPLARVTTTTYNNRGWAATTTDPLGRVTTYSYTATGKPSTVSNPGTSGATSEGYGYDDLGRLTSSTDALGAITTYTYDGVGNRTSAKDPNGNTTTYQYDSRNRPTTVVNALNLSTVYGYDSGGNRTTVKDPLGNLTTTSYDALDRATAITGPRGDATTMAYDAAGRRTGLTDPTGNRTTWAYDSADRLTTMTDPQSHSATYAYDVDDRTTETTDRNGRRTTYAYDSGGRQTGETWVGASPANRVTYSYDAANQMTGVADSFARLTFTYDSGGNQLTAATSGPGSGQPSVTLTSTYSQMGYRTGLTDDLGSVGRTSFAYDATWRLTSMTTTYGGSSGPRIDFGYDSGGRLTGVSRSIQGGSVWVQTSNAYDAADRLVTISHSKFVGSGSGGSTTMLATYAYSYDDAGRITSERNAEGAVTYAYDSGGQLTGTTGSRAETYTYDSGGNRTMTGYSTGSGNEMPTSPGTTYTYDNEGNLIAQANTSTNVTTSFTYDFRNRLTGVSVGGLVVGSYTYDPLGRRIGFKSNGTQTWTVFDGGSPFANPYADFNGSGTILTRYISDSYIANLFARTSAGGTTAWYLSDRLGSVRDVVDTSGSTIDHVIYDSYGNISSETVPGNGDRFKYAGMQRDAATGIDYDRARWYSSTIGRFMTTDPIGFASGDTNLYRYTGNSPSNYTDPTGLQDDDEAGRKAADEAQAAQRARAAKESSDEQKTQADKRRMEPKESPNVGPSTFREQMERMKTDNERMLAALRNARKGINDAAYREAYGKLELNREALARKYWDQRRLAEKYEAVIRKAETESEHEIAQANRAKQDEAAEAAEQARREWQRLNKALDRRRGQKLP